MVSHYINTTELYSSNSELIVTISSQHDVETKVGDRIGVKMVFEEGFCSTNLLDVTYNIRHNRSQDVTDGS